MNEAISEQCVATVRSRRNKEHDIDPQPLRKKISDVTDMLSRERVVQTLLEGGYRRRSVKGARPIHAVGAGARSLVARAESGWPTSAETLRR